MRIKIKSSHFHYQDLRVWVVIRERNVCWQSLALGMTV